MDLICKYSTYYSTYKIFLIFYNRPVNEIIKSTPRKRSAFCKYAFLILSFFSV